MDPFAETFKVRGSTDSEDLSDPEPHYHETLPPSVYAGLAKAMVEKARKEVKAGNYQKAEAAQWKAMRYLEDREAKLGTPFVKRDLMLEGLADIHLKEGKYEAAKTVVSNLLKQDNADSKRSGRLYSLLATICLAQGRLSDAERFAKRAYISREKVLGKGHAAISQSVDLLITIYDRQGDAESAQAWRDVHPDDSHLEDNPQVFKHVGTTRVAWNPDLSVDMNALTKDGKTVLINAIVSGDEDMVWKALQRGADIEKTGSEGITPLMYAIIHSQERIAGVLLSRGADPEATTLDWPPLHKACDQEDVPLLETLLEFDANIESRAPKKFQLSKLLAQKAQPPDFPQFLNDWDEDLDAYSGDDDETSPHGWTPLLRCALKAQDETLTVSFNARLLCIHVVPILMDHQMCYL